MTSMVDSHPYCSGLSQVADCQQKSLTPLTYLVSIGQLLFLAFLYGWLFLTKISLDWLLTLTTQPSTSKLSDNPDCQSGVSRAKIRTQSMKLNWNFQQGVFKPENHLWGVYGYFVEQNSQQLDLISYTYMYCTTFNSNNPHLHRRGKTGGFQICFFHCSRHVHNNKEMAHLKSQKLQKKKTILNEAITSINHVCNKIL